jgi:NTP pyrophosphatase (non-canonical NTP hydrolase)
MSQIIRSEPDSTADAFWQRYGHFVGCTVRESNSAVGIVTGVTNENGPLLHIRRKNGKIDRRNPNDVHKTCACGKRALDSKGKPCPGHENCKPLACAPPEPEDCPNAPHGDNFPLNYCDICSWSRNQAQPSPPATISFPTLRSANIARQQELDAGNQLTLAYRGNELAGEVGEACNIIKKIERERLSIAGSRATVEQLTEELADVIICCDLIAMDCGIDLDAAVRAKFNKTSEKVGLRTRLAS